MIDIIDLLPEYISPEPNTGCWICTSRNNQHGYARVALNGKLIAAHRLSYELAHGKIQRGLEIDHLCRISCCVNPDHLEAVSPYENKRRAAVAKEIANGFLCPSGHLRTSDNIYTRPNGARMCRKCRYENKQRFKKNARATTAMLNPSQVTVDAMKIAEPARSPTP